MQPNGYYVKRREEGKAAINAQEALLLPACSCGSGETKAK
jgi:hypothetical protein